MIEKMKVVCIAAQDSRKDELLLSLRGLGILHLAEKRAADPKLTERFSALSRLLQELKEYEGKGKQDKELTDAEFDALYRRTADALERKAAGKAALSELLLETERIREWGDFDPQAVKDLFGVAELHFYRMDKKEYRVLCRSETLAFIRLRSVGKAETVALIGRADETLHAAEFRLPERSLSQLEQDAADLKAEIAECDRILTESAAYLKSYAKQLLKMRNEVEYSSADASLNAENGIVWITGYIPQTETE